MAELTWAQRAEWCLATLVAVAAATALPLSTGYMGWSWDALNHHIYLGLLAEQPRWDLDVLAASFQGYQFPYLYWPVYRISLLDLPGAWAGALWAAFQVSWLAPPVWLISHRLLPSDVSGLQATALRLAGCALAGASTVVIASVETTANDLLASVPLLWAVAVGLGPNQHTRQAWACGALWGASVAFKLSNGLAIIWLALWAFQPSPTLPRWARPWRIAAGAALGFVLTYAPWGWQLWKAMGNPFHPLLGHLFGAV